MIRRLLLLTALTLGAAPLVVRADAPAAHLTKPPKLVTFVEADYPAEAKASGKQAKVTLSIAIGADGHVLEVKVQASAGAAFDDAAVAAAKQFVFSPAEIDGKPAAIRILYEYAFALRAEKKTTADLAGLVRDRKTKAPLAGVVIQVGERSVTTGADGRFELKDLPPGKQVLALSGPQLTALQTEETLEEGKRTEVVYDLAPKEIAAAPEEQDDLEIVVVAPPLEKTTVSTSIAADEGRKVPGTSGDVVKVVESMPGVARSAAGSGALVVWGAAPEDTRVYVDGVRIPILYHLGGVRSVLASDLVKGVELVPGGFGAAYGRGLGGVVLVTSRPLDTSGGSASVDLIDAAVSARARLSDRWRVAIAGRRSHLDSVIGLFTDRDVGELFPISRYWDGQLRLSYDASKAERVELTALTSSDRVDRVVGSADPTRVRSDRRELDFTRVWLTWSKELAGGATVRVTPFVGVDRTRTLSGFGAVATSVDVDARVLGVRATHRSRVERWLEVTFGLDGEVVAETLDRSGSVALPAREGDARVFGAPPPDRINADSFRTVNLSLAPYGELDFAPFGEVLHITPGLRVDPYVTTVSRRTPLEGDTPEIGAASADLDVEPRLAVTVKPQPRVTFKAAVGRYRQPPQSQDLSAVFGNPTLPPAHATHLVLGGAFQWTSTVSSEVTAFYTRSSDLAVRSPLSSPLAAEALVSAGEGRAFGVQMLVRKSLSSNVFGWIGWTISRSERRDATGGFRLFDYDQSHVVNAVVAWELGRGFELGARVRYGTGFPRTPVIGATWDVRRDVYEPRFGEKGTSRLPSFFQADLRLGRKTMLGAGVELETWLDVQNVTNRANAEEVVYDQTFTKKGFVRGIPILPVLGARLSW